MKTIAIGCDHAAFEFKETIKAYLQNKGYDVMDCGVYEVKRADYPVYAFAVGEKVVSNDNTLGILCCGTGVGMSIAANKVKGVRAVVCSEPFSAKLSRAHNNANVLCLGARVLGIELAKMIVDIWLETEFEGGRHADRLELISKYENNN